jgi:hypothetical protein
VPRRYSVNQQLSSWGVGTRRQAKKKDRLTVDRDAKLNSIGFCLICLMTELRIQVSADRMNLSAAYDVWFVKRMASSMACDASRRLLLARSFALLALPQICPLGLHV